MKKVIQFNSSQIVEFENEIVAGISFDFKAQTNAPALATISDLSKISIDILVKKSRKKEYLIQTTLNKLLIEKFEGTEITKEVFSEGNESSYRVIVGFSGAIQLNKGETIEVKCYAQNTSFTSLSTSDSEITIESVPSIVPTQYVDKVEIIPIEIGSTVIDKPLGSDVKKVIFTTQLDPLGDDYARHTLAKITDVDMDANGFKKNISGDLLLTENQMASSVLGDLSAIKNLKVYDSRVPLSDTRLRLRLDKATLVNHCLIVTRRVSLV